MEQKSKIRSITTYAVGLAKPVEIEGSRWTETEIISVTAQGPRDLMRIIDERWPDVRVLWVMSYPYMEGRA